jgi:site-specific DNA recombinase
MMPRKTTSVATKNPTVRCAIYTRKSTEEGLEQEFNSLDAQRESGEAFITAQRHEGWQLVHDRYDDGGFTGGNMDRPALKRLMADIAAGKVDCVIVYKVDRLSRSLLDFAKMMEVFDQHEVSFVSVTQQFNTASSMGRLVLNVLLSFAQFEREMISERIRDKIAATRRKGKWSGGMPLLGYTVENTKLVVDETEAAQVRQIFELYLEYQALLPTVKELNRRGWTTKRWVTKKGTTKGGRSFTKNSLYALLTNVTYLGQIKYKDEVHAGEHTAIITQVQFDRVQKVLLRNGHSGGRAVRNKHGALLKGLLRCGSCQCAMSHTYTCKGTRRYRYYLCGHAQRNGRDQCPAPSVPAGEIERFVVDQIHQIGNDPKLITETIRQVRLQSEDGITHLAEERTSLQQQLRAHHADLQATASLPSSTKRVSQLADLQERIGTTESRLTEIDNELAALQSNQIDESEVTRLLAEFHHTWEALAPRDQARVIELLIERIDYRGQDGQISLTFRPSGIQTLTQETAL